jgi:hypothetical protein
MTGILVRVDAGQLPESVTPRSKPTWTTCYDARNRRRTLGSSGAGKISRSTVKTHLQSVNHKLGAASRSEAIERAVDLRLL